MLDRIDIQDVVTIAKEAGNAIMQLYKKDFKVNYKQDNSPLTLADKVANNIIEIGLNQLTANLPILSEEGVYTSYRERKYWEYFWLIDPLDGTKEFIKKNDEFTVNIALIYKNMPVLGVVYAPALDICYWSKQSEGAFKNGQRLPVKSIEQNNTYKIVVSRSHISDETKLFIENVKTHKEKEVVSIGSSLKICLVAEGVVDMYPRLAPTMEWDTGAAHAIIEESGAKLRRYVGGQYLNFLYNKEDLLNDWFIVEGAE
jgi:3'(2'), 5'-bisphosphate nucleotidase